MRPDKQLDYAVFQLNPTRTRCELHIAANGTMYKLAAGLLHPFIAHLKAAEVQLAGGGYSIRLEPPEHASAGWFTKGTLERFVRFVSTPEMLEQISSIEIELLELGKVMRVQSGDASGDAQHVAEEPFCKPAHINNVNESMASASEHLERPSKESSRNTQFYSAETQETAKQLPPGALESRQMLLENELEVALARALSAGFTAEHTKDLILFAETFGAKRLWVACSSLMSSFKRRQPTGQPIGLPPDSFRMPLADASPTETGFSSSNMIDRVGLREKFQSQGRTTSYDDLRRASFPGEGLLSHGDSGSEKLTRRGSLDELTGEFLQVSARMRTSGMLESAYGDRFNSWQPPTGGGNHSNSGEMNAYAAHLGGNKDTRDGIGHHQFAAWKGPSQSHSLQNVHSLMHGGVHPSIPTSYGFQGMPLPGYSYPLIPSGPYLGNIYGEANCWQFSSALPSPYWPHPNYDNSGLTTANEGMTGCLASQRQEVHCRNGDDNKIHEQPPLSLLKMKNEPSIVDKLPFHPDKFHAGSSNSAQASENNKTVDSAFYRETQSGALHVIDETASSALKPDSSNEESCKGTTSSEPSIVNEQTVSTERLDNIDKKFHKEAQASDSSFVDDLAASKDRTSCEIGSDDKFLAESTGKLSPNSSHSDYRQQMSETHHQLAITNTLEEDSTNDFDITQDGKPLAERTRRLPIRSSSPSKRSASPLRKVQIGRSGSRRIARGVNFVVQNIPDKIERENNERESPESWSEDNDLNKSEEESKEQPVRSSVQDVIGLFERKKNGSEMKPNLLRKDTGRIKSNNAVLKRWTESVVLKTEAVEQEDSRVKIRNRKAALLASHGEGTEGNSNEPSISGLSDGKTNVAQEEDIEVTAGCKVESAPRRTLIAPPGRKESKDMQKDIPDPDSEVSIKIISKNKLTAETGELSLGKIYSIPVTDLDQASGIEIVDGSQKTGVDKMVDDRQENDDNEYLRSSPAVAHPKKLSSRDEKAKLMQDLLEKRKMAWGNRAVKPNPLAEAQVRAEKLRAYKAGLQKSKQEKDEEEKKRIKDLKSQRKEKTALRGGSLGAVVSQSPASKQMPPLTSGNRSSPTASSHKHLVSKSPQTLINMSSSLSPSLAKVKGSGINKLPRTPKGSSKENENALSHSVPSLSELKKGSLKALTGLRSSTGSQRFSQLKKNLKDAETSPKANGHSEEKKHSLPLVPARKGIPPSTDSKMEGLATVRRKPRMGTLTSTRQQRLDSSVTSIKKPPAENVKGTHLLEQVATANDAAAEEIMEKTEEAFSNEHKLSADTMEDDLTKNCSFLEDVGRLEEDNDCAQISSPAGNEVQELCPTVDSSCLEESCNIDESTHEEEIDKIAEEGYYAPVAQMTQEEECRKELDVGRETDFDEDDCSINLHTLTPAEVQETPSTEVYEPPGALPSDPSLHAKNLPRLLEAIQQAHSPEFSQAASVSRKMHDESVSLGLMKDHHSKGFKRLLFLGRKSSRSSSQHASDWVSVPMMSEAGDGVDASKNTDIVSDTSTADTVTRQAEKIRDTRTGNLSTKGSKSFFSLSTFRGKVDGK